MDLGDKMTYVVVMHKVEDYDKWKLLYDENGAMRKDYGSKGASVFHQANDPNNMVVITEWEDMEKAKNFAESEDLKTTMQKAGVIGQPVIYYLDKIEKTAY
jgi:heme-degrading monooxygenase HmoA